MAARSGAAHVSSDSACTTSGRYSQNSPAPLSTAASGSCVSSDEVISLPAGLQPVRTAVADRKRSKRQVPARQRADKHHRQGCFVSMYSSICQYWAEWTRDMEPGLANRFFFQDSRPKHPSASPGWPSTDWFSSPDKPSTDSSRGSVSTS